MMNEHRQENWLEFIYIVFLLLGLTTCCMSGHLFAVKFFFTQPEVCEHRVSHGAQIARFKTNF